MTTNFYSVIEEDVPMALIVSFVDKEKANFHAESLSLGTNRKFIVVPSEITLFTPVK